MPSPQEEAARIRAIATQLASSCTPTSASFLRLAVEERQLYAIAVSDFGLSHAAAMQWVAIAALKARVDGVSIFFAAGVLSPEESAAHSKHFAE